MIVAMGIARRLLLVPLALAAFAFTAPRAASGEPKPPPTACRPVPMCPAAALESGARRPFRRASSRVVTALGAPRHRATDALVRDGGTATVRARFLYGPTHKDLGGEDVDVWVLRSCARWERAGATVTDDEGNARFELRASDLGPGLHRVRFVLAGDGSSADALVDVLAPSGRFFVTDVDGTITTTETTEWGSVLKGTISDVHPDAARVANALAARGYRPLYLSARPDWLAPRTHELLDHHGFPPGIVRVTPHDRGAWGAAAAEFKSSVLAELGAQGLVPSWGFGNKPSDTDAYERAGITPPSHRIFYRLDDAHGGRRIATYGELLPELASLPCP